jgi:hypothetical protein
VKRLSWLTAAVLLSVAPGARAQTDVDLFTNASSLLEKGAYSDALLHFELLSDRGFVHPDASFDRALAYLQRADSAGAEPGDLGQAVAGLREAAALSDDDEAARLVETVRQVISRRRAARGRDPVVVSPPLGRAVSELVRPSTWAALALFASVALTLALLLRRSPKAALRLGANVAAAASLLLLVVFGGMFALSAHYQRSWQEAVVIVDHATLRDAQGRPLLTRALDTNSDEVPEGASVYVVSHAGRLFEVQWGSSKAWLRDGELRILAAQ